MQFRSNLGELAGEEFEDDQWGFGQVVAVATAAFVLVDLYYNLKGIWFSQVLR